MHASRNEAAHRASSKRSRSAPVLRHRVEASPSKIEGDADDDQGADWQQLHEPHIAAARPITGRISFLAILIAMFSS
jgi:hypothetical protein